MRESDRPHDWKPLFLEPWNELNDRARPRAPARRRLNEQNED